jgi:methyl-coenzyme M reductase alpha subunit
LFPNDPIRNELESIAVAALVYDQLWFGTYMSGGVGFTQYASATYTDNILEDFCYKGCEIGLDYADGEMASIKGDKLNMDILEAIIRSENDYCMTRVSDRCRVALRWVSESMLRGSGMR